MFIILLLYTYTIHLLCIILNTFFLNTYLYIYFLLYYNIILQFILDINYNEILASMI